MNQDTKLKLQSFVDGELDPSESREVAAWLDRDSEARTLCEDLREISQLLVHNELEIKLPESREFYWSKIERAITQSPAELTASPSGSAAFWWMRIFAPVLGLALVLMTTLSLVKHDRSPVRLSSYPLEIETPLEDTSTISFHSASTGMTVVWVQSEVY